MIVIGERNDDTNILHLIIGPETEFQFNMTGQSVVDITDYISVMKEREKTILVINRCDNEEDLTKQLAYHQQRIAELDKIRETIITGVGPQNQKNEKHPIKSNKVKCPLCGAPDSSSVIDGIVTGCPTCQKISQSLRDGVIPPPPSKEEIQKIKEDLEKKIPDLLKQTKKKKHKKNGEETTTNG